MTFEQNHEECKEVKCLQIYGGEEHPGRGNNQCKSSDAHLRLEGMEGIVAREYELEEKGGNEVTQIM